MVSDPPTNERAILLGYVTRMFWLNPTANPEGESFLPKPNFQRSSEGEFVLALDVMNNLLTEFSNLRIAVHTYVCRYFSFVFRPYKGDYLLLYVSPYAQLAAYCFVTQN